MHVLFPDIERLISSRTVSGSCLAQEIRWICLGSVPITKRVPSSSQPSVSRGWCFRSRSPLCGAGQHHGSLGTKLSLLVCFLPASVSPSSTRTPLRLLSLCLLFSSLAVFLFSWPFLRQGLHNVGRRGAERQESEGILVVPRPPSFAFVLGSKVQRTVRVIVTFFR